MDFGWSDEQQAVREKTQAFIRDHLPANWEEIASLSPGSKEVTDYSRIICPELQKEGLLLSHWPKEYGGAERSAWEHFIIGEQLWEVGEPRGPQYYNVNWIGPTILHHGTPDQKELHLNRIREGNVIWCQGFSEPSGGSDLAALRTRADRDGNRFLINGSKIWTSYARMAEYCLLLARTRPEGRAITVFMLPMNRPGITVRPISSVVGDGDLHEVFFDDVEVFESEILGKEGEGWDVVKFALNFERVGIPRYALALRTLHRVVAALIEADEFSPVAQDAAAQALVTCEAARMLAYECVDQRSKNMPSTGLASMARYAVVCAERQVADFVLDWAPHLFASREDVMVATHHKRAIAAGLAAGAAEIQLNLVARDILNLR